MWTLALLVILDLITERSKRGFNLNKLTVGGSRQSGAEIDWFWFKRESVRGVCDWGLNFKFRKECVLYDY